MENKSSITRQTIKIIILTILIVSFITGFVWSYYNIIEPSVMSAKHACNIISDSELNDFGYIITGTFNLSSHEIIVKYDEVEHSDEYYRVLRHERVHYQQFLKNRLSGCSLFLGLPLALVIDEIEAKTMERFSEDTLNFIYRTDDFTV